MRVPDGSDLANYGVQPGCAFAVRLPEYGGHSMPRLPFSPTQIVGIPITPAMWQELRDDGLIFVDLLDVDLGRDDSNHRHLALNADTPLRRIAFFTASEYGDRQQYDQLT